MLFLFICSFFSDGKAGAGLQEGVVGGFEDAGDGDAVGGVGEGRFAFGDAFVEVLHLGEEGFGGVDGMDGFIAASDDHAEGFE